MSEIKINKISVLGAGGWGTALATILAESFDKVILWSHDDDTSAEINTRHTNSTYIEGIKIPENVVATNDFMPIGDSDMIICAVPSQYIRHVINRSKIDFSQKYVVNGAKGIERNSLLRISGIFEEAAGVRPEKFAVITGPSHAEEVARHLPTTVVTASENHSLAEKIQDLFTQPYFRVYTSEDLTGCETGGSLKNVIAIAAGIIDGLGLGDNTKAALLTRGLAEMSRLGIALGANPLTFSGLSGLGDLFVTCNSKHSRNRRVGEKIGKGKTLEEISKETKTVAEGVFTAESAYYLGLKHNVEMPIAEQVFKILFEGREPTEAIKGLMARSTKREWWW
ncbi:MAG: NAD(P)H-dependent glycerol-3-phosphate dehydrogenase [Candidatus Kapaibacterium sp.]